MKKLLMVIALVAIVATLAMAGSAASKSVSAVCLNCGNTLPLGSGGYQVVINGSGYQSGGKNQLTVIVWGSSNPVDCGTPDKVGNFSCSTTISQTGVYNVLAYQNAKTLIAATNIIID